MKSINSLSILAFVVLAVLPGCGENNSDQVAKKTGLIVINVLDKDTYKDCHIAGSINVPFESLESCVDVIDKDAELVFYCSNPMCTASGYAAQQFKKAGFTNVNVYEGGTAEWFQKGLPVEGPATASYLCQKVEHTENDSLECRVLTADELAQKMGFESPSATQIEIPSAEHIETAAEITVQK